MATSERARGSIPPDDGVTIDALRARAREIATPVAFAKSCAGPALLLHAEGDPAGSAPPAKSPSGFNIVTLEGAAAQGSKVEARRLHGRVVFVAKRPGNPFPNMISLGRAASNDVVIGLDTISKLHGYFLREGDAWYYTDYQSTNGTAINGKKVEKGERRLLSDGDHFKLGLDVTADFLTPNALYERLRGRPKLKPIEVARETLRRAVEHQVLETDDISGAGSLLQDPRELIDSLKEDRFLTEKVVSAFAHLIELKPGKRPSAGRKTNQGIDLSGDGGTLSPQRVEPPEKPPGEVPRLGGESGTMAPERRAPRNPGGAPDEGGQTVVPLRDAPPGRKPEGWVSLDESGSTVAAQREPDDQPIIATTGEEADPGLDLAVLEPDERRAIEVASFCRIALRLGKLTRDQIAAASADATANIEDRLLEMGAIDQAVAMEIFAQRQVVRVACANCFGILPEGGDRSRGCPICGQTATGVTSISRASNATLTDGHAAHGIEGFPGQGGMFAGYELLERIAEGGMGVVFKARQTKLNRVVALKVMRGGSLANKERRRRFRQEAESAAAFGHPYIVPVHEIDEVAGYPFYTMDFVEGVTMDRYVADKKLEPRKVSALVRGVADAVQHFHLRGIIHRDLKPGNILVGEDGVPKIIDFGIAKKLVPDSDSSTIEGEVLGTPYYMSPEQATGRVTEVDTRTDVYALGAILYEFLTGAPPWKGLRQARLIAAIQEEDPESIRATNPAVELDLESIVMKAMAKERERRYQSAADLAVDLQRYESNMTVTARPATLGYRLKKYLRRRYPQVAAAAAILAMASVAGGLAWAKRTETRREVEGLLSIAQDKSKPMGMRDAAVNEALGKDRDNETARALRDALASERAVAESRAHEQQMEELQKERAKAARAEAFAQAEHDRQELNQAKAAEQARLDTEGRVREAAEKRAQALLDRASSQASALDAVPDLQEALVVVPKESAALRAAVENKKIDLELALARENVLKNQSGLARFWLGDARRLENVPVAAGRLDAVEQDLKKLESGDEELKTAHALVSAGKWIAAKAKLAQLGALKVDPARFAADQDTVDKACAQVAQQLVSEGRDRLRAGDYANGMAKALEALQFASNENARALVSDCEQQDALAARSRAAEDWKHPESQKSALAALAQAAERVQDPALKALLETERGARTRLLEDRALAGLCFVPAVPDLGVAACYVQRTEVTNADWKQFVDAGGYDMAELWKGVPAETLASFKDGCPGGSCNHKGPRSWTGGGFGDPANADRPVRGITSYEARAYAAWRCKTEGGVWRLPTDREWEVAAGFDPKTRRLSLYPWGDEWRPEMLGAASDLPRPVGTNASDVSALGVQDAAGNVMEWVEQKDKTPGTKGTSFAASEAAARRFALVRSTGAPAATPPNELLVWIGVRLVRQIEVK